MRGKENRKMTWLIVGVVIWVICGVLVYGMLKDCFRRGLERTYFEYGWGHEFVCFYFGLVCPIIGLCFFLVALLWGEKIGLCFRMPKELCELGRPK